MKIAVISDSHDNIWNLEKALTMIKEERADAIIHCGDFVAPFVLKRLNSANIPVYGVLGNNDGSGFMLAQTAAALKNITLFETIGSYNDGDYKIGFTHKREVAEGLMFSGRYNLVCYGHSHRYTLEKNGNAILLNPGEIMGGEGSPSFCMVDTITTVIKQVFI